MRFSIYKKEDGMYTYHEIKYGKGNKIVLLGHENIDILNAIVRVLQKIRPHAQLHPVKKESHFDYMMRDSGLIVYIYCELSGDIRAIDIV